MKLDTHLAAVVTGGASGLGAAVSMALRAKGIQVAVLDRDVEKGVRFAAEIGATYCKTDVTDAASVAAALLQARAAHGQERIAWSGA